MTVVRLSIAAALAAALVTVSGALAGRTFWTTPEPPPQSGMELLNDFRCWPGETHRLVIRGIEDGFSPGGMEPSHKHPRLPDSLVAAPLTRRADYDHSRMDTYVLDYFELPRTTARGLFVISLKSLGADDSDTLVIGDILEWSGGRLPPTHPIFYQRVSKLGSIPGWRRSGSLIWARLSDISLRTSGAAPEIAGGNLLEYVRSGQAGAFDVKVADDTSVDFMGVAFCEEPATHGGLTARAETLVLSGEPLIVLSMLGGRSSAGGNPFVGDTDCDVELPLACFRDERRPAPAIFSTLRQMGEHEDLARFWTGGSVKLSSPVKGSAFATVADADRLCRRSFGPGWRVVDYHASGAGVSVTGYGRADTEMQRVWVDIKDQPYGVCWKRAPR
ncbi:MAG: hypothetical protein ACOY4K_09995 [Pseudomonadota bacterium]